jgi:hypothetical protein
MSGVSDTADLAAIGAAARELKLPTVRADAARLATSKTSIASEPASFRARVGG